jgi:hypothetical protein
VAFNGSLLIGKTSGSSSKKGKQYWEEVGYSATPAGRGTVFCVAATARTISGGQLLLVPYPLHGPAQGLSVGQFIT